MKFNRLFREKVCEHRHSLEGAYQPVRMLLLALAKGLVSLISA
jgi:hypothetical protein